MGNENLKKRKSSSDVASGGVVVRKAWAKTERVGSSARVLQIRQCVAFVLGNGLTF